MILLLHRWEAIQRLVTSATQEGVSVARSVPNALDLLEMSDYELAIVEPVQFGNWEELAPHVGLLLLTQDVSVELVERAISLGVKGVVGVDVTLQELKVVLAQVRQGAEVYPNGVVREAMGRVEDRYREVEGVGLSPRQKDVLELTARGMNATQIGERLGVTSKYVNNVRARVYEKLKIPKTGQGRVQEAVRWAVEHHLV